MGPGAAAGRGHASAPGRRPPPLQMPAKPGGGAGGGGGSGGGGGGRREQPPRIEVLAWGPWVSQLLAAAAAAGAGNAATATATAAATAAASAAGAATAAAGSGPVPSHAAVAGLLRRCVAALQMSACAAEFAGEKRFGNVRHASCGGGAGRVCGQVGHGVSGCAEYSGWGLGWLCCGVCRHDGGAAWRTSATHVADMRSLRLHACIPYTRTASHTRSCTFCVSDFLIYSNTSNLTAPLLFSCSLHQPHAGCGVAGGCPRHTSAARLAGESFTPAAQASNNGNRGGVGAWGGGDGQCCWPRRRRRRSGAWSTPPAHSPTAGAAAQSCH